MNKTVKRIVIFYLLSFIPGVIISVIAAAAWGNDYWVNENTPAAGLTLVGMGMMLPSIAHILTRDITKEGFDPKKMFLTMKIKGSGRYYALAFILPVIWSAAGVLIAAVQSGVMGYFTVDGDTVFNTVMYLLNSLAISVILFIPAFGEEFGWRAYLYPKLEEIMPEWAAIIVGGVLWGLWHAPLTVCGHNFGVDYAGYPFGGIAVMCLSCTCMGVFLSYITKKTGSVMPAAFCHMVNNNCVQWLLPMFRDMPKDAAEESSLLIFALRMLPVFIVGAVFFVLMLRNSSKQEKMPAAA